MRSRARLGAGVVAAALTVGMVAWSATSAGASGPSASGNTAVASAKPVVVQSGKQDADPIIAAAAKRFGLPAKKIEQGVIAVKIYVGEHGGKTKSGEPDFLSAGAVRVFAHTVGISQARAKQVLAFIVKLADKQQGKPGKPGKPGVDPVTEAAKRFGLPAKKIEAGLIAVKQYLGTQQGNGKAGEPDFLSPGAVRVFARTVGISQPRAKEVLAFILKVADSQPGKPGKPGKPGAPGKPGDPGKPAPGKP